MEKLAVIVVNYCTPALAIESVLACAPARAAFPGLRVVVVDGASNDGSVEQLAAAFADLDWVTVLPLAVNGGFAFANNRAILALERDGALPELIALINPDARVRPGALEAMATLLDREPRAAAAGAALIGDTGERQSSTFRFPSIRGEFSRGARTRLIDRLFGIPSSSIDLDVATEVPWVTGAAVTLRTAALRETGLFDEGFFLYFEETDLMRRLRRDGWSIWHEPMARVVHDGGAATQIRDPRTGMPTARRMPRYWYEARRRYFALSAGRPYALLAGLAWLGGQMWWRLRRTIERRPYTGPARSMRDLIAYGLWPNRLDGGAAIPRVGEPVADRPAWMTGPR